MTINTLSKFSKITADEGYVITDGTTYAKIACVPLGDEDKWSECEPPEEETTEGKDDE